MGRNAQRDQRTTPFETYKDSRRVAPGYSKSGADEQERDEEPSDRRERDPEAAVLVRLNGRALLVSGIGACECGAEPHELVPPEASPRSSGRAAAMYELSSQINAPTTSAARLAAPLLAAADRDVGQGEVLVTSTLARRAAGRPVVVGPRAGEEL
jgi:hypothetical protein